MTTPDREGQTRQSGQVQVRLRGSGSRCGRTHKRTQYPVGGACGELQSISSTIWERGTKQTPSGSQRVSRRSSSSDTHPTDRSPRAVCQRLSADSRAVPHYGRATQVPPEARHCRAVESAADARCRCWRRCECRRSRFERPRASSRLALPCTAAARCQLRALTVTFRAWRCR